METKSMQTVVKSVDPELIMGLPVHPHADQYPMRPHEELMHLGQDMKTHGQNEPIVVCDGVLIDGRNRLRAAQLAGVDVRVQYLSAMSEQQLEDLIVSHNIKRRHMRPSDLAKMALEDYDREREAGNQVTLEQMAARRSVSLRTVLRLKAEQKASVVKPRADMARVPAKLRLLPRLLRDTVKLTSSSRRTDTHRRFCARLQWITREIWSRPELYENLDYAGEKPGQPPIR